LPPQAPPPPPVRRSGSRLRRGLFRLAVLLSAAVAVLGVVYAVLSYQNQSQPGNVVQSYFNALLRGDAPGALSYGTMPDGTQTLLSSTVLRQQNALGEMTEFAVTGVEQHGGTAEVAVRYVLRYPNATKGPLTVTDHVHMTRSGR